MKIEKLFTKFNTLTSNSKVCQTNIKSIAFNQIDFDVDTKTKFSSKEDINIKLSWKLM